MVISTHQSIHIKTNVNCHPRRTFRRAGTLALGVSAHAESTREQLSPNCGYPGLGAVLWKVRESMISLTIYGRPTRITQAVPLAVVPLSTVAETQSVSFHSELKEF